MKSAASGALAVTNALTAVMAEDRGRMLATLIARLNNFQLAEDALHEAATSALSHWGRTGLPHSPKAWLLTVANRKAIDIIRRRNRDSQKAQDFAYLQPDWIEVEEDITDERLRLIFTCCHPALEPKSQLALTLRTIAGLSTREIARAFVDQEQNIGQRISRAKAKISAANIPFIVPGPEEWPQRLQSVLAVIYLIFTTGYTSGGITRRDLAEEAIFLAGLVNQLRPGDAESEGCLALLIITHSRRAARVDTQGMSVPLDEQDRTLWYKEEIRTGLALLDQAVARRAPGPYQIKAAIAACHVNGDQPDWVQIAALYNQLIQREPTAVVQVNRAVAIAKAGAPQAALDMLISIEDQLTDYQPFYAAKAELLSVMNKYDAAIRAFDHAIALASSPADAVFLERRRDVLNSI